MIKPSNIYGQLTPESNISVVCEDEEHDCILLGFPAGFTSKSQLADWLNSTHPTIVEAELF